MTEAPDDLSTLGSDEFTLGEAIRWCARHGCGFTFCRDPDDRDSGRVLVRILCPLERGAYLMDAGVKHYICHAPVTDMAETAETFVALVAYARKRLNRE